MNGLYANHAHCTVGKDHALAAKHRGADAAEGGKAQQPVFFYVCYNYADLIHMRFEHDFLSRAPVPVIGNQQIAHNVHSVFCFIGGQAGDNPFPYRPLAARCAA